MSEGHKGALITPELTALVHWTTGRCAVATPQEAVKLGQELLAQIQQELNEKFRSGVDAVRRTQVGGGGAGDWAPEKTMQHPTLVTNGTPVGYQDGAVV